MVTADCINLATSIANSEKPQFVFTKRKDLLTLGKKDNRIHNYVVNQLWFSFFSLLVARLSQSAVRHVFVTKLQNSNKQYFFVSVAEFVTQIIITNNTYMYTEVIKLIVYNKVYTLHAVCK